MASGEATPECEPRPTWRDRIGDFLLRIQFATYTILAIVLMVLAFLWPLMFIVVPTGSHGVMFRYFSGGTITDRVWGEGVHIIPPWDHLTLYESRLQQRTLKFDVLSDEGLDLAVSISVRFRPYEDMLGHLHKDVGPDYFERMIEPDIQAHVRRTFGNRPAHEIYASASDLVLELRRVPALGRLGELDPEKSSPYVHIQEIKLVDLELPDLVQAAIAEKYRQEQLMLEYRYRLEREEQEAERKRTEAGGIRDYNAIIGRLSPDVLRWRDMEATKELARSPNSKVLVLGGGDSKASLLFNVGDPGVAGPGTPPEIAVAEAGGRSGPKSAAQDPGTP